MLTQSNKHLHSGTVKDDRLRQNISIEFYIYFCCFFSKSLLVLFLCDLQFFSTVEKVLVHPRQSGFVSIYSYNNENLKFAVLIFQFGCELFIFDLNFTTARSFRILASLVASLIMNLGCCFCDIFCGSCCKRSLDTETRCELL